ncbi:hypothetical protein CRUP_001549, partial [Coryphaenoides rupestris]
MAGWAGFSDAELLKLQQKAIPSALGRGRRPPQSTRSRQQMQRERAVQVASQQHHAAGPGATVLPPEHKLSKPPPKAAPQPAATATAASPDGKLIAEQSRDGKPPENQPVKADVAEPSVKELETQEVELREKTRIEQLQDEQKIMEERNKCKKALLAKTIAEKSKQTQQEAVKLKRIQKELQTLDDMVSNDVSILRCRIEQASWDYSAARKRYEKAEAEYVVSKMELHKKTEVKEQLTEHLCAIIQQNELRKAYKLEELMQQLQLHTTEEELSLALKLMEEEKKKKKELEVEVVKAGEDKSGAEQNGEKATEGSSDPDRGSVAGETAVPGSGGTLPGDPPPPPSASDPTGPERDMCRREPSSESSCSDSAL